MGAAWGFLPWWEAAKPKDTQAPVFSGQPCPHLPPPAKHFYHIGKALVDGSHGIISSLVYWKSPIAARDVLAALKAGGAHRLLIKRPVY